MNSPNESTPTPGTTSPAKAPVPATAAPQVPAKDPTTTAPAAAKGDDDVMSQHKKPS